MFGKDGDELDGNMQELIEAHPELYEIEKKLPKRNLPLIRPNNGTVCCEGSLFD